MLENHKLWICRFSSY